MPVRTSRLYNSAHHEPSFTRHSTSAPQTSDGWWWSWERWGWGPIVLCGERWV